jgi:hypothetical protein
MSLSEHKDGVGASTKKPDCHVPPAAVASECGGYDWDTEVAPSLGRLEEEESKLEPPAKLEFVDEIRKRRLGGRSEEHGHPSAR